MDLAELCLHGRHAGWAVIARAMVAAPQDLAACLSRNGDVRAAIPTDCGLKPDRSPFIAILAAAPLAMALFVDRLEA
jgi:hypothetical protein